MTNPLDQLAEFAQQRATYTNNLYSTIVNLFDRLRMLVPTGTSIQVSNNLIVSLIKVHESMDPCWSVTVDEYSCSDISRPMYYHGHTDRGFTVTGPTYPILVAVGKELPAILQAMLDEADKLNAELRIAQVRAGTAKLDMTDKTAEELVKAPDVQ